MFLLYHQEEVAGEAEAVVISEGNSHTWTISPETEVRAQNPTIIFKLLNDLLEEGPSLSIFAGMGKRLMEIRSWQETIQLTSHPEKVKLQVLF